MKLVVGLGNPGQEYEKTRHSIGFFVIDQLVPCKFKYDTRYKADICKDQDVIFLKPMEFMNRSGGAVSAIANFYKISTQDILVIHDDIDLPVAKIQLKQGGSSAGHNGLKDIIAKIGTPDFWRIRIGIDRPAHQDDVSDYVLSDFSQDEKTSIADQIHHIKQCVATFLSK